MSSLTIKRIAGRPYYYLRECQRVDGRPKIVWQKYLGTAQEVVGALTGKSSPLAKVREAVVLEWGALVALYDVARRIGLVEIVDRHAPRSEERRVGKEWRSR